MIDEAQEAPREEPGFRIYVERDGDRTDVTHAVMDVYDIAAGSMDFGSGFLSTEEVGNLRTLGKAIGADHFDYQHDKCLRCGHDYERHYSRAPHECFARLSRSEGGCPCKYFIRST